jgi:hypothetical protein
LDENIPRNLRADLPECFVRTVQEEGWGGFKNGELLRRAEAAFDVLVTADRRMQFQQTLTGYSIGVVVIVTPRLRFDVLHGLAAVLRGAVENVQAGEVARIEV